MTNTITANIIAEIYNGVIFTKIWKTLSLKQGSIRSNVSEGGILCTPFTKIVAEFRKQDSDYFCACLFPTIQSQSPRLSKLFEVFVKVIFVLASNKTSLVCLAIQKKSLVKTDIK